MAKTTQAARQPRMSRLLSLREVADMMGMEGPTAPRRVREQLLRLEERSGRKFLTRLGSDGTGARYRVTAASLRQHHQEFFNRKDEVADALREYVGALEAQVEELSSRCAGGAYIKQVEGESMNGQTSIGVVTTLRGRSAQSASDASIPNVVDFSKMSSDDIERTLNTLVRRAKSGAFIVRAMVDGRFATECLNRSRGNVRKLSKASVDRYRRDMESGSWRFTAEPWTFAVDDAFVNAHHRAEALRTCKDVKIEIAVAFGVPVEAVVNMDRGNVRRQSDALGEHDKRVSAVRAAMTIRRGGTPLKYSDDEVRDALLQNAVAFGQFPYISRYPAPVWGVLLLLFPSQKVAAKNFAHELVANETVGVHSSVRLLRLRLRELKMDPWQTALVAMTAVRAFIDGRNITKLQVKDDGAGIVAWLNSQIGA